MSAEEIAKITEEFRHRIGSDSGLNAKLKFNFEGQGTVFIDGTAKPNTVSNADDQADCTITISLDTFKKLVTREIDATMAFMQGKLKVAGDMGVAMRLGPILQRAGS